MLPYLLLLLREKPGIQAGAWYGTGFGRISSSPLHRRGKEEASKQVHSTAGGQIRSDDAALFLIYLYLLLSLLLVPPATPPYILLLLLLPNDIVPAIATEPTKGQSVSAHRENLGARLFHVDAIEPRGTVALHSTGPSYTYFKGTPSSGDWS